MYVWSYVYSKTKRTTGAITPEKVLWGGIGSLRGGALKVVNGIKLFFKNVKNQFIVFNYCEFQNKIMIQ